LEDVFDRIDYQFSEANTVHLNLGFTRSWFQNPNSYDNLNVGVTGGPGNTLVGPTDQRSKIETYNIAPTWTRLINPSLVFTLGGFVRHDGYNYYPSENPFADLGPLQSETVAQDRSLTNAGALTYLSYAKGIHNLKAGISYEQTFLTENDHFGVVNPTLNSPCLDGSVIPFPVSQVRHSAPVHCSQIRIHPTIPTPQRPISFPLCCLTTLHAAVPAICSTDTPT
jgi:hypothetical protein